MTNHDAAQVLKIMEAAWPSFRMDEPTAQLYILHLSTEDPAALSKAVHRLVETESWFPTVAKVKAELRAVREETATASPNVDFQGAAQPLTQEERDAIRSILPPRSTQPTPNPRKDLLPTHIREWVDKTVDRCTGKGT